MLANWIKKKKKNVPLQKHCFPLFLSHTAEWDPAVGGDVEGRKLPFSAWGQTRASQVDAPSVVELS